MAPKSVQRPAAKKKMNVAPSKPSSTGTKTPDYGNKNGEEDTRCPDGGNGSTEKVDEVVKSLVSEVISKAEAEVVEDSDNVAASAVSERRLSEPPHRPDNSGAVEERRRRIERGDSEAYIEEVLKHVFTAPTTTIIPTRPKSASVVVVKAAAPTPDKSSKPLRPVKMQESQQNTAKSAPKPVNLAKSSTKTPAEKPESVKREEAKRPAAKKSDPVKKEDAKRPAEVLKSSAQGQEQEQKQSQPPAKTKMAKQHLKADSKKLPTGTDTLKSDPVLAPLKEETSDAGHIETRNPKAPPRQSSTSKLQMGVSSKRHDGNSQKSDEAAVTAAAPTKRDDSRNKTSKPAAPTKSTVKPTTPSTKAIVKNTAPAKRAAPPTKASKP